MTEARRTCKILARRELSVTKAMLRIASSVLCNQAGRLRCPHSWRSDRANEEDRAKANIWPLDPQSKGAAVICGGVKPATILVGLRWSDVSVTRPSNGLSGARGLLLVVVLSWPATETQVITR